MFTRIKTAQEVESMRVSGKMLGSVLKVLAERLEPGMTTKDLANIAADELRTLGGKPAFLGYQGFPDVLCVSVNNEVVHGIPKNDKLISHGDIVSMDFGVVYNGMVTDAAISVIAGEGSAEAQKLVQTTQAALYAGINQVKNGVRVGTISAAVQRILDKAGYGIVRDLVGHGVGHQLHEDPNIPNYGSAHKGPVLSKGMTIAIEPMANLGSERVFMAPDNWTILTSDNSLSAHFEHTVLITDDGFEVLTD